MSPEILTSDELADRLKAKPETVRRLTRDGKIPALRLGGEYRYDWTTVWLTLGGEFKHGVVDSFGDLIRTPSNTELSVALLREWVKCFGHLAEQDLVEQTAALLSPQPK